MMTSFLLLAICLFAANYFISGLGKLELDWVNIDRLYDLLIASYVNGWLVFWPEAVILRLVDLFKLLNPAMTATTMVIELGALLIFVHKRVALCLLASFVLLHTLIFASSGIFFWKWMLAAIGFAVVLQKLDEMSTRRLFSPAFFVASLGIIYFSPHYFKPVELAWYDTNLSSFYELEVVGDSGRAYAVSRSFMAPYDLLFAQNRFQYLSHDKLLTRTYGATSDTEIAQALQKVASVEMLADLEMSKGKSNYNEEKARKFDYFLQTYFENLNRRGSKTSFINHFSAPHHIWNSAQGDVYTVQEKVQQIRVRFIKTFYDGQKIMRLQDEVIRVIAVP
jgi:hypothetical protein